MPVGMPLIWTALCVADLPSGSAMNFLSGFEAGQQQQHRRRPECRRRSFHPANDRGMKTHKGRREQQIPPALFIAHELFVRTRRRFLRESK